MNIKKTFAIIGLLAVFTTTTAFATTGTYDQYLVSGDSSVAVNSQVKDDGEQIAYVTPDATSDWNPGLERYNVRVRDSSYNYATEYALVQSTGTYRLHYIETGYAGQWYYLFANYDANMPTNECHATGRWTP